MLPKSFASFTFSSGLRSGCWTLASRNLLSSCCAKGWRLKGFHHSGCSSAWNEHNPIVHLQPPPLQEGNCVPIFFQLVVADAQLFPHLCKKIIMAELGTSSKQKVIYMNHEDTVDSVFKLPCEAWLLRAPLKFHLTGHIFTRHPVPSFGSQPLTWEVAQDYRA